MSAATTLSANQARGLSLTGILFGTIVKAETSSISVGSTARSIVKFLINIDITSLISTAAR